MPDPTKDWDDEELEEEEEEEEESSQPHTFNETERHEPHPLLPPGMHTQRLGEAPHPALHEPGEVPDPDPGSMGGRGQHEGVTAGGFDETERHELHPLQHVPGESDTAPEVQDLALASAGEESRQGLSVTSGSGNSSETKQSAKTRRGRQMSPTEGVSDASELGFPVGDRSYEVPLRDERDEEEAAEGAAARRAGVERSKGNKKRRATNRKSLAGL